METVKEDKNSDSGTSYIKSSEESVTIESNISIQLEKIDKKLSNMGFFKKEFVRRRTRRGSSIITVAK